jgi:hypothetical protein
MLEQQRWHAHPSDTTMPTDVSSTFVKPLHTGSSQYTSPYPYATGGNSHSPSAARPVPTTSISAEKEPSAGDRDHSPHSIGGGTRLPGRCAIDYTYPVSNLSLRACWIDSSRYRSGSACDSTSQDNTCEDTHSRHHQREQDVDLQRLQ